MKWRNSRLFGNSHGFAGVRKALRECQSPVCILPNFQHDSDVGGTTMRYRKVA